LCVTAKFLLYSVSNRKPQELVSREETRPHFSFLKITQQQLQEVLGLGRKVAVSPVRVSEDLKATIKVGAGS
jgi:hypothetical protein